MTFDFVCPTDGPFEQMFIPYVAEWPCPICGEPSPQVWLTPPQVDSFAAGFWNNPQGQGISDKQRWLDFIDGKGLRPKEPGSDEESLRKGEYIAQAKKEALKQKVEKYVADHTIDELRAKIKVDAAIHEAQMKHDGNAIHAMGGLTSADEAYQDANANSGIYTAVRKGAA